MTVAALILDGGDAVLLGALDIEREGKGKIREEVKGQGLCGALVPSPTKRWKREVALVRTSAMHFVILCRGGR